MSKVAYSSVDARQALRQERAIEESRKRVRAQIARIRHIRAEGGSPDIAYRVLRYLRHSVRQLRENRDLLARALGADGHDRVQLAHEISGTAHRRPRGVPTSRSQMRPPEVVV
ncbi:hypothetical protein CO2235_MP80163 [Cupriavidus oxalaticus]|uniref:Uncharacterized protein n=1 Tax=Cupriavidus oxalaticus TaxID=96344 RepID=A0A375FT41_9BURK|nr:hypothetical protein CO2235_U840030 [Cupriavidus oxalaticus]SPC24283.1 hypothetical protein CO2235_MP80163 [Cupriavidus oxalaticus]